MISLTIFSGHALTTRKLTLIVLIIFALAALTIFRFVYTFVRPYEESVGKFVQFLDNSMWLDEKTGQVPKFIANNYYNQRFFIQLIFVGIVAICSYLIAVVFGVKTYQKLQFMRHFMSHKTLRLHRTMTWMLIIKVSLSVIREETN